ncbi:MAG: sensor histidine kinase [Planctomycetota bacterium]|jgi:signal transduction histidine kinase
MKALLALVGLLLCTVTAALIEIEHRVNVGDAEAAIENRVRLAFLKEQARPASDYLPFPYLQEEAYTRGFQKLQKDEVVVPSPLLNRKPPFIRLHFQVDSQGAFTSPQVPTGTASEIAAQWQEVPEDKQAAERALLDDVKHLVDPRAAAGLTLRPAWFHGELFFLRRLDAKLQGFWVDWPALRASLKEEVPDATLTPGDDLHTLPVDLAVSRFATWGRWSPAHTASVVIWVVAGLAAVFVVRRQQAALAKERRFSSLVTHELRGPLTTFRLYHELLEEGQVPADKQHEYFTTLRKESDRMAHMVENVIAHARVESGRSKLDVRPAGVASLVRAIDVDTDLGNAAEVEVRVDAVAVGQVLHNLIDNARKYGAEPVTLRARVAGDHVELRVSDAGPGPDCDPFRPFERGAHEGTPNRGLGVGLTLSRGLARQMGGDLALEPPATFVLSLPRSPGASGA